MTWARIALYSAVGFALFLAWFVFNLGMSAEIRPGVPASAGPQLAWLRDHLGEAPRIFLTAIDPWGWWRMFVAQLGWLNVVLPDAPR